MAWFPALTLTMVRHCLAPSTYIAQGHEHKIHGLPSAAYIPEKQEIHYVRTCQYTLSFSVDSATPLSCALSFITSKRGKRMPKVEWTNIPIMVDSTNAPMVDAISIPFVELNNTPMMVDSIESAPILDSKYTLKVESTTIRN